MKPDWCPSGVWDRSVEVTMGTMAFGSPRLTETISRALIAERERALEEAALCAGSEFTKDTVNKNSRGVPYESGSVAIYAAGRIEAKIRDLKATP